MQKPCLGSLTLTTELSRPLKIWLTLINSCIYSILFPPSPERASFCLKVLFLLPERSLPSPFLYLSNSYSSCKTHPARGHLIQDASLTFQPEILRKGAIIIIKLQMQVFCGFSAIQALGQDRARMSSNVQANAQGNSNTLCVFISSSSFCFNLEFPVSEVKKLKTLPVITFLSAIKTAKLISLFLLPHT